MQAYKKYGKNYRDYRKNIVRGNTPLSFTEWMTANAIPFWRIEFKDGNYELTTSEERATEFEQDGLTVTRSLKSVSVESE